LGPKTYGDIYGSWWPGSLEVLQTNIGQAMKGTDRLHFNLDQLDLEAFQQSARNPVFISGSITNWELNAILHDPPLLLKTIFHGPGGAIVPPPRVR